MKKLLVPIIVFLISFYGFSQSPLKIIDSLKLELTKNPSDSIKIKTYSDLCWYYRTVSTDSAFAFGELALKLSKATKNLAGEAQAHNDIGILHYGLADYDQAMQEYNQSLKIRKKLKDTLGLASLYNKIGLCYQNTFQLDLAIVYNTKALEIYEHKNIRNHANALKGNIANIYRGLKQYDKALKAHLEIMETAKEIQDYPLLLRSYNNIANAYLHLQDTANSVTYFKQGIEVAKTNNLKNELGALYNNYGALLSSKGQIADAIDNTLKSLLLRREIKDNQGIASSSLNLGDLYLRSGDFNKSKKHLTKGVALAEQYRANELLIKGYHNLSYYFAFNNNIDSVKFYQNKYKQIEDSIFNQRITKEVAEVQEKYNANQRENEILTQRAELAENERDLIQKNNFILGLVGLAIVLSLLAFLVYNQQKLKHQQLKKESELKEALIKIEAQNSLQDQRLRISRDLHDNIGAQLTFVISSLDNLKYGFKLPEKLDKKLNTISTFTTATIYELRDTIWAMNKSEITFEDLHSRISNFVDKANLISENISFKFRAEESVKKELKLTSIEGMNIYRIIQEAINNALKYAKASEIEVYINAINNKLHISISDNGKGFDIKEIEFGNGINNMKKRAQDIAMKIDIQTSANKGTIIKLEKKLNT